MQSAPLLKLRQSTTYTQQRPHLSYGTDTHCCISPVLPVQDAVFNCFTASLDFQPLGCNLSPLGQISSRKLLLKRLKFLNMKWETQPWGAPRDTSVPQRDSSKHRQGSSSINCHSCFSKNRFIVIRSRHINGALSGKSLIWDLATASITPFTAV